MDLPTLWFLLIAVFWAGYLVLEGFDFGVGMLLPFVARGDAERGQAIRTFGPVWDANEVWLIVAGASMFAAFPNWYASMFSAMYLPLLLLLVALIVRVLAIEYRMKLDGARWKLWCDRVLVVASFVAPFAVALALANVVRGIPLDADSNFTGDLTDLLSPYAVLGGVAVVAVYALHGATFLGLRADGPVRVRARRAALVLWPLSTVLGGAFGVWTVAGTGGYDAGVSPVAVGALAVAAIAFVTCGLAALRGREAVAFASTATAILAVGVLLFAQLWPNVLPSTDVAAGTVTVQNGASSSYTLGVMTWVAVAIVPVVLLYQSWSYWVFRHRVMPAGFAAAGSPLEALRLRNAGSSAARADEDR
jgi:cytochrome d ubiquinol oxidase subunit II